MKKQFLTLLTLALATTLSAQIPNYVPSNGLVGWWPFNGNANDESGNGNNGTVNGASLTTDRFGVANKAYSFDGLNDFIDVGNPVLLGNNPNSYTQAGWVFMNDFTDAYVFMTKRHDNSGNDWATPVSTINNTFIFFADDAFYQNAPKAETSSLLTSQWYHLTFVKSNNVYSVYVNGILGSSITDNHLMGGSTNNLIIGAQLAWPEFMKGKLDDIGIWNRALTQCEIQDLYNAELNSAAGISAGLDQTVCEGEFITLTGSGGTNYVWNNSVVDGVPFIPTASMDYPLLGQDANGCIGTDTVNVVVNSHSTSTQTQTALDSYTWPVNGQTYTQSGLYYDTLTNAAGCDSVITLDLTLSFTGIESLQMNSSKKLSKITDLNGRETPFRKNTVLLFIYEDGTVERAYVTE